MDHDKTYVLAIDQGTSSTKAIVFNRHGKAVAKANEPLVTHYLDGNRVEQDAESIYRNVLTSVKNCLEKFKAAGGDPKQIAGCGLSNQRETFLLWDRAGKPLYQAIVWQCKRSVDVCMKLKNEGFEASIKQKTGLIIDPYFSGTKVIWLYENHPGIRKTIDDGNAFFGTIDTWLIYRMTGGKSYMTDYTNASRTLFLNLSQLRWDTELLDAFGLSKLNMPELKPSSYSYGTTDLEGLFDNPISISAAIGDSHAAAFGECCFESGEAKATLGTGCSILMNIGDKPRASQHGMVTTICWSTADRVDYALEGLIVSAGATIEWLKNQLGLMENTEELESIARSIGDNGGVYLVPGFSGLGAPYWDMTRKASITGLSFDSSKRHVIRAALESIPYQIKDVVTAMESDMGARLTELKIDGGITSNEFVIEFLADLLERRVTRIEIADASALGAAYLAGLNVGIFKSIDEIRKLNVESASVVTGINDPRMKEYYEGWKQSVG